MIAGAEPILAQHRSRMTVSLGLRGCLCAILALTAPGNNGRIIEPFDGIPDDADSSVIPVFAGGNLARVCAPCLDSVREALVHRVKV